MAREKIPSPSAKLLSNLQVSISTSLSTGRPILTHLNADTSWLLSLPSPPSHSSSRTQNHRYYHIVLDPWLRGSQADVAKFFSQQWHCEPSAVQTIADVEEVIRGIEDAASDTPALIGKETYNTSNGNKNTTSGQGQESPIDIVLVSHEFTDHMHKETLLELSPAVPVLASTKAASIIRSWKYFAFVAELPRFGGDWRASSTNPLPDWVGVSRVEYPWRDLLYYHSAVMVCFRSTSSREDTRENTGARDGDHGAEAEAVIYTPHGITPSNVASLTEARPKIHTLALLHGLQDIKLPAGAQLNKGAHNGLKVLRVLGARYWIGTHDEVKKGGGIVSWFLNRKIIPLDEAIQREQHEKRGSNADGLQVLDEVRYKEVGNGEALVLE